MRLISFRLFKKNCGHSYHGKMYPNGGICLSSDVGTKDSRWWAKCTEKNCPVMQKCVEVIDMEKR